ncbi:MAG: hypothetical protein J6Z08_02365 [Elusimicrobiales bacterium]|nr:hypothetical protein [Elusimicrobiales bacterium]
MDGFALNLGKYAMTCNTMSAMSIPVRLPLFSMVYNRAMSMTTMSSQISFVMYCHSTAVG